jgi:hypothetical protein
MYRLMMVFHIAVSCTFFMLAIGVSVRSLAGWIRGLRYTKADFYSAHALLIMLYLTLVNGFIMYFFIDPSLRGTPDIAMAVKSATLRFWVVEHFYFMTFALVLTQIGTIFINKTAVDKSRFMYGTFYYGITTLITMSSMILYLINR